MEEVEEGRGEGGERTYSVNNSLTLNGFAQVKHEHLICLFLRRRKPVTHDVDASRALPASPHFNGFAPNMNLNILLLWLPVDRQNTNVRGIFSM